MFVWIKSGLLVVRLFLLYIQGNLFISCRGYFRILLNTRYSTTICCSLAPNID